MLLLLLLPLRQHTYILLLKIKTPVLWEKFKATKHINKDESKKQCDMIQSAIISIGDQSALRMQGMGPE